MKPLVALLLAAASPAWALQPSLPNCDPSPALRAMADLPGETVMDVESEFRDGRIVRKTLRIVRGLPDRRAQRMAIATVDAAMGGAVCPGIARLRARVTVGPARAGFESVETEPSPGAIGQN